MSEKFEVESGNVAFRSIYAGVDELEVVEFVRNDVAQVLVVSFSGDFERSVHSAEGVVGACDYLDAALRLDVAIESDNRVALGIGGGIAIFLVERSLVV